MGLGLGCGRGDTRQLFEWNATSKDNHAMFTLLSLFLSHFVSLFFDCSVLFSVFVHGFEKALSSSTRHRIAWTGWLEGWEKVSREMVSPVCWWCLRVVSVSRVNNGSALLSLTHPISPMQNTAMYHGRSYPLSNPSLPSFSVTCPSISHFCTAACIVQDRGRKKNNGHATYALKYLFICVEMYPVSYSTYVLIVRTVLLAKRAGEWQRGGETIPLPLSLFPVLPSVSDLEHTHSGILWVPTSAVN